MAPQVHRHHPRSHPATPPAPAHPHLPPDAHIGHDSQVLELLQSYQDQIPEGVEGHGTVIVGYAAGPNPSVNGDFIGGDPRPHWACYFWTEVSTDSPLSVMGFDYIVERIREGKTTFND